jgi:hypothetical protein
LLATSSRPNFARHDGFGEDVSVAHHMEIFFSLILASVMVMPTWRAESSL